MKEYGLYTIHVGDISIDFISLCTDKSYMENVSDLISGLFANGTGDYNEEKNLNFY